MNPGQIAYQYFNNGKTWLMQYPSNVEPVSDMIVCIWRIKSIKTSITIQYTFDNPKGKVKQ